MTIYTEAVGFSPHPASFLQRDTIHCTLPITSINTQKLVYRAMSSHVFERSVESCLHQPVKGERTPMSERASSAGHNIFYCVLITSAQCNDKENSYD